MHAMLHIWPIEYYSYSYCASGSGICMHADLMLLYLLYLWIMISRKKKCWAKLLSISLPSPFRGNPGLAKYHTVWATFNIYFLLDAFTLTCAIRIVSAYVSITATSWQITSTVWLWRELDLCLQNPLVFPEWPSFQYSFMNIQLLLSAKLNAHFM